jgi:hypothetical protein
MCNEATETNKTTRELNPDELKHLSKRDVHLPKETDYLDTTPLQ